MKNVELGHLGAVLVAAFAAFGVGGEGKELGQARTKSSVYDSIGRKEKEFSL